MPLISDMSEGASTWWTATLQQARDVYGRWLATSPLNKTNIQAETRYKRLEARVLTMLLAAVPAAVKQEAISTRELTCVQLLYRALKQFQPGGLGEKAGLLNSMAKVNPAKTALGASESLRQWQRQLLRAQELGLQVPDPLLLVGSLTEVMKLVLGKDPQASFRVNTFRMNNMVDVAPTQATTQSYLQLLVAEADYLHHSTAVKTPTTSTPDANPKLKAMGYVEKGNKGQGKTGGSPQGQQGSPGNGVKLCRNWGSETGCKYGRTCKFGHDWNALADKDKRCFKCSSLEHMAKDCPTPDEEVKSSGGKNSKGSPKGKGKGENKNDKGKSKGKGKPDKAGEGAKAQVQQLDASATASTTAPTVGAQKGTQPSTTRQKVKL